MRSSSEIANEIKKINTQCRKMNDLHNDGGEGYNHTADTTALENEFHAALKAEFAAEWTAETTEARRVKWNADKGTTTLAVEKSVGFKASDLKKAIAMHK